MRDNTPLTLKHLSSKKITNSGLSGKALSKYKFISPLHKTINLKDYKEYRKINLTQKRNFRNKIQFQETKNTLKNTTLTLKKLELKENERLAECIAISKLHFIFVREVNFKKEYSEV